MREYQSPADPSKSAGIEQDSGQPASFERRESTELTPQSTLPSQPQAAEQQQEKPQSASTDDTSLTPLESTLASLSSMSKYKE